MRTASPLRNPYPHGPSPASWAPFGQPGSAGSGAAATAITVTFKLAPRRASDPHYAAAHDGAPALPSEIAFFLRTRHASPRYPFPADVDEGRLLHVARLDPHDPNASEPRCTILLSPGGIVGLENFDSLFPLPTLYVTVPSGWSPQKGAMVNPTLERTEQSFQLLDNRRGQPARVSVAVRLQPRHAYDGAAMSSAPLGWS